MNYEDKVKLYNNVIVRSRQAYYSSIPAKKTFVSLSEKNCEPNWFWLENTKELAEEVIETINLLLKEKKVMDDE